jgi:hypothetical protein
MTKAKAIKQRLEELRVEIQAERISIGEILELQSLAEHIEKGDVELLQWAGVPEFEDNED